MAVKSPEVVEVGLGRGLPSAVEIRVRDTHRENDNRFHHDRARVSLGRGHSFSA
jgi:hypothetical protein